MAFGVVQYQQKTEAPRGAFGPIVTFESWFSPLSEPVRVKIAPKRAIALIASGAVSPILPTSFFDINLESKWHQAWSEPVRVKRRLHAALNPFNTTYFNVLPVPANQIQGWFRPLNEPVRLKPGMRSYLQQSLALPSAIIPPPNVFVTINAFEINGDLASFGIMVNNMAVSANVSIREIPATDSAAASIEET